MKSTRPDRRGQTWVEDWDPLDVPSKLWLVVGLGDPDEGEDYYQLVDLETGDRSYVWAGALVENPVSEQWRRVT